jgi:site-specific recombinase XerD
MAATARLPGIAEDWLHARAATAGTATGNSDRARRQDLARCGRILRQLSGEEIENLLEGFDVFWRRYKSSTVSRSVSTQRSFCRWLVNRGHLDSNPVDDEALHVRHRAEPEMRAFSTEDVTTMLDTAATPPSSSTSAWAARDVATIDVLAFVGLRAAEFCSLQIRDIGGTDRPILHIRRGAKGNKRREIPLPPTHHRTTRRLSRRARVARRAKDRSVCA